MSDDTATADPLSDFVHRTASALWHGYQRNQGAEVATLAKLRRGFPHGWRVPAEAFAILGDRFDRGPRDQDGVSYDERAAAAALALFALHQQSNATSSMHRRGADGRLGRAVARLAVNGRGAGAERRINALITASDSEAALEHLRGLVQLLRADGVPLDYAALARDLRSLHSPPGLRTTRIRWSRDFHRVSPENGTAIQPAAAADHATSGAEA